MFVVFSNHFNVLMSKNIFKKSKNIINIYFDTKNYLKKNTMTLLNKSFYRSFSSGYFGSLIAQLGKHKCTSTRLKHEHVEQMWLPMIDGHHSVTIDWWFLWCLTSFAGYSWPVSLIAPHGYSTQVLFRSLRGLPPELNLLLP